MARLEVFEDEEDREEETSFLTHWQYSRLRFKLILMCLAMDSAYNHGDKYRCIMNEKDEQFRKILKSAFHDFSERLKEKCRRRGRRGYSKRKMLKNPKRKWIYECLSQGLFVLRPREKQELYALVLFFDSLFVEKQK